MRLLSVPLADGQFAALVSFVFNLGGGNLQASTTRASANRADYAATTYQLSCAGSMLVVDP